MTKQIIINAPEFVDTNIQNIKELVIKGLAAGPVLVTLGRSKRTLSQNSKLWPMLTDLSNQVDWYGHKLTPEEWKQICTASLKQQKTLPSLDGGFVVIGASTSKMNKEELSDLIELIYSFGAEQEVKWSDPLIYKG